MTFAVEISANICAALKIDSSSLVIQKMYRDRLQRCHCCPQPRAIVCSSTPTKTLTSELCMCYTTYILGSRVATYMFVSLAKAEAYHKTVRYFDFYEHAIIPKLHAYLCMFDRPPTDACAPLSPFHQRRKVRSRNVAQPAVGIHSQCLGPARADRTGRGRGSSRVAWDTTPATELEPMGFL